MAGMCMFADVSQAFPEHAGQAAHAGAVKHPVLSLQVQFALEAGLLLERIEQGSNRRHKRRGGRRGLLRGMGKTMHGGDGGINQRIDPGGLLLQACILRQLPDQPGQRQLDGSQVAAQLIVHVTACAAPFIGSRRFNLALAHAGLDGSSLSTPGGTQASIHSASAVAAMGRLMK